MHGIMLQGNLLFFVYVHLLRGIVGRELFDDSIRYDVSWAGPFNAQRQNHMENPVLMTTKDNEQYYCSLPRLRDDLKDSYVGGSGPSAEELLKPLTTNVRCSYRLDTYWTYELCHGSHVRQYHDEKPMKGKNLQEYILGKASKDDDKASQVPTEKTDGKAREEMGTKKNQIPPPKRNVNGREVPYYEVTMANGTPCELLNGKPRQAHIIYMCKPDSHNEIISVKEIQSCIYQLEVLTPLLCGSDWYKVQEDVIHQIRCHSLKGSPMLGEPQSHIQHIEESEADRLGFREYQYMPVQGEGPVDPLKSEEHRKIPPQPDKQLTQNFLDGTYCLRGGSGWWQHEYCHSKHVLQYHKDQQGKTVIYLGMWNTDVHREWAKKNPNKKSPDYVTHYYGNGEICDITGKARTVQVKLRCMKSSHQQELSIYLLEPKPCQYVLGVDSPILCPLIKNAADDGIFPTKL